MKYSTRWRSGNLVRSRTRDSEVAGSIVPPEPLSSNNLEQVIYCCGAQANSAVHPCGEVNGVPACLAGVKVGCRVTGNTV